MTYRDFINMLMNSFKIRFNELKYIHDRIDINKDNSDINYLQYYNGISEPCWDGLDKLIRYIDEDCHEGSIYKSDEIL